MVFLEAFESMLGIMLLTAIGYVLTWRGWVDETTEAFMPRLLVNVVIPPYLMASVVGRFQSEQLWELILGSLVPLASMATGYAVCRALASLLRVQTGRRGLFATASCLSNTIFIGIPVNLALFGESALPYCLVYFFANTLFFWTVGAWSIGGEGAGAVRRPTLLQTARRVLSLPLIGMVLGIALVLAAIPVPRVILDTCGYLGGISTPLALIYVGVVMRRTNWQRLAQMGRDLALCVLCRVALCPLILCAMLAFLDMPRLMEQVFVIQSCLPVMMTVSIYAGYVAADKEFASLMVAGSALTGMLTVPTWMVVIQYLL